MISFTRNINNLSMFCFQTYEMFLARYKFKVLNNPFTSHRGYQDAKTRPKWRSVQRAVNNRRFPGFAISLSEKYGRDPCNMLKSLKGLKFLVPKNVVCPPY